MAIATEIKAGRLIKQPCSKCLNPIAQAHHEDYTKPLDIVWLCSKCHSLTHNPHSNREANKHKVAKPKPLVMGDYKNIQFYYRKPYGYIAFKHIIDLIFKSNHGLYEVITTISYYDGRFYYTSCLTQDEGKAIELTEANKLIKS